MRDGWEGGAHRGVLTVPTCGAHLGGSYVMIMIMILIYGTCKYCVYQNELDLCSIYLEQTMF